MTLAVEAVLKGPVSLWSLCIDSVFPINLAAADLTASTRIVEPGLSSTTLSGVHRP